MKKFLYSIICAGLSLMIQLSTYGQVGLKVTRMHHGASAFYTTIASAIAEGRNGDTIYIPGGVWPEGLNVDSSLTIVGAGHYPDSTLATNPTVIQGGVNIQAGCPGGGISGCKFNSSFILYNTNYNIERCFFDYQVHFYTAVANMVIRENVFNNMVYAPTCVLLFMNNIFNTGSNNMGYIAPGSAFYNNIFYNPYYYLSFSGCILNNNIFIFNPYTNIGLDGYSTYTNNLFCSTTESVPVISCGNSYCTGNIDGQLASNTFVNALTPDFAYGNNYHLKPGCPGINYGTDGTDVGIFGTALPYKEAAMPFNPHISHINIGNQLSPTGTLNVDVKVSAQSR